MKMIQYKEECKELARNNSTVRVYDIDNDGNKVIVERKVIKTFANVNWKYSTWGVIFDNLIHNGECTGCTYNFILK